MSERKPIWSWRHAIQEADLKAGTKALLYTIANDLTDTGKYSQIDVEDLARMAGLQKRAAEGHIAKAKKAGLLKTSIRRDSAGHPIGRKWLPAFPPEFELAREAQHAESAFGGDDTQTQNAENARQNADFAGQNAKNARTYKETSSQTFTQTSSHPCASDDARGVEEEPLAKERGEPEGAPSGQPKAKPSGPAFDEFWKPYPVKKGKARAEKRWKTMVPADRIAAIAAIPRYLADEKVARGFVQEGGTFLCSATWKDYVAAPEEQAQMDEDQIVKALALDLADGHRDDLVKARKWFQKLADVPAQLRRLAEELAASFSPQGAYA